MKKLKFYCLLSMILVIAVSCEKDHLFDLPDQLMDDVKTTNLISPKIKIAVVPDIHYMHPDLLPEDITTSPSLMTYLGLDRKLLEISDPIFRKVYSELIDEKPDILLIPGDLAKDGELIGHEVMANLLQDLENTGMKVYVIPGNNDIDNPDAFSYVTEPPESVDNINSDDFTRIYGNFGYNEALYRDETSLSYICQPYSNLWILGIDNIKYPLPNSGEKVTGDISDATLAWIGEKMAEARANNIEVLAMMHYGILEHYSGQNIPEPLIKNFQERATALMNAGIRFIFTGHYHANDIVEFAHDGKTLYDIQTGSLVTPPSSYRILELDDNFIKIQTRRVTSIDFELPDGMGFLEYSDVNINLRLNSFFTFYLQKMFKLPEEYAIYLAPYATEAYRAYFAGDEKMPPSVRKELDAIPENFSPLVNIVRSLWTDLDPHDNKIHIKLK